ncbi:MAG: hypothetical protein J0L57_12360 [Burkholderiales bacterium]|nr:hypothetical protein [Burkholderiales bacterium]
MSTTCSFAAILAVVKDAVTVLAAGGALLYFGYKVFAGWLLLNLSPKLELTRESVVGEEDRLIIKVALAKGKTDALRILRAELRITQLDPAEGRTVCLPLQGITRVIFDPQPPYLDWEMVDRANPYLNLAPEETIEYAEYTRIPSGSVVRVELLIAGDRFRDRCIPSLSQWRTSAVSTPPTPH